MAAALTHALFSPSIQYLREGLQKERRQRQWDQRKGNRRSFIITSSKKSKNRTEDLGLWEGGLSVPALQPREEDLGFPFSGNFSSKPALGFTVLEIEETRALKAKEVEDARNQLEEKEVKSVIDIKEGEGKAKLKGGEEGRERVRDTILVRGVEGVEETEVEYDLEEDEEEEVDLIEEGDDEWLGEGEEEEGEEEDGEDEYVEVWEGDLPPPTAEEEAELLREAEEEIAQLEKEQLGKTEEFQESVLPPSVVRLEKELAEMRSRVEEMEEELLQLKGSGLDKNGHVNGGSKGVTESSLERGDLNDVDSVSLENNAVRFGNEGLGDWSENSDEENDSSSSEGEQYVGEGGGGGVMAVKFNNSSVEEQRADKEWEEDATLMDFEEDENRTDNLTENIPKFTSLEALTSEFSHLKRKAKAQERAAEMFLRDEEEEVGEDGEPKKRGLPAIMRCFDMAKIYVRAGDGGNGVVAFRREKYVPFGGPSGGSGGRGGDVYIRADRSLNSLLPFRKTIHFRAGRGTHGQGSSCHGTSGKDMEILVPPGTLIRQVLDDEEEGPVLLEVVKPGQREMLLPGGRGGRGNAAFKTGRNRTPQLAENGEEGTEMWIKLELKLVADVGIVGVPNAGKSTLLSVISAAKPKVADYPFTTLVPNLGVAEVDFETLVVADVPGLLEGAHDGFGLGHEFLRHTERCRCLVHVIDGTRLQPEHDFEAICNELELFNPTLASKPQVVAYNKMDVPEAAEKWPSFEASMARKGVKAMPMSAATGQGALEILRAARDLLKLLPSEVIEEEEEVRIPVGEQLRAQRRAAIEEFKIEVDRHRRVFEVDGEGLRNFVQMTNWEYFEAVKRFQHVLEASGVNQALLEAGVRDGDNVVIGKLEFDWRGSEDIESLGDWKRGNRGTKVWPH